MTTFSAGAKVPKGYYLDRSTFQLQTVEQGGTPLTGGADARFVRLPWPALLFLAPLLGAGFVFLLPAIAFVGVGYYAARGLYVMAARGVQALAPVGVSSFVLGEASLARRWKQEGHATPRPPTDQPESLAALEREIARRRAS